MPQFLSLPLFLACVSPQNALEPGAGGRAGNGSMNMGGTVADIGKTTDNEGIGGAAGATAVTGGTGGTYVPVIVDDREYLARLRRDEVLRNLPKPIGEWLFDDGEGSVVKDSSGNRNTGTVTKGSQVPGVVDPATLWGPGHKGSGLQLNGIDQWVNVPYSDSIARPEIKNTISISAWVFVRRFNSPLSRIALFQRHQAATRVEVYFLGISENGTLLVGTNFFHAIATTPFPTGRWTHVAMTHNGIEQCGYVDGKPVACHDTGSPFDTSETPFTMGAGINETDVTENLNGAIDEVRLYDTALTAEQVAALARNQP